MVEPLTLFDLDAIPRWVVEVNEVLLNSIADRTGAEWWALWRAAPFEAFQRRIHIRAVAIPGDLVYVEWDSKAQAIEWRDYMVENGCHPKAVKVGHLITCNGCGRKRPFWASLHRGGLRCKECFESRLREPL